MFRQYRLLALSSLAASLACFLTGKFPSSPLLSLYLARNITLYLCAILSGGFFPSVHLRWLPQAIFEINICHSDLGNGSKVQPPHNKVSFSGLANTTVHLCRQYDQIQRQKSTSSGSKEAEARRRGCPGFSGCTSAQRAHGPGCGSADHPDQHAGRICRRQHISSPSSSCGDGFNCPLRRMDQQH